MNPTYTFDTWEGWRFSYVNGVLQTDRVPTDILQRYQNRFGKPAVQLPPKHEQELSMDDIVTVTTVKGIPEGYVLVPVKLTEAMQHAIEAAMLTGKSAEDLWNDVLQEAPQWDVSRGK